MLAGELRRIVETQEAYAQAKSRALAQLDSPFGSALFVCA
jgi:hypothetical protein